MADFKMPAYGIDLEEYRRLMEGRNRPLTDEPMERRNKQHATHQPKQSLLDQFVQAEDAG